MRAAEIRFFWYRAELFSLFSRLPRARCSRGAPFLFFPPPLDVRKRRAGLPKRRGSGTPPMNSNPFQKNTCSENVEFPLSRCCSQKVLDRKGTARKGVLPRKTRAHKVASQKEDAKRLFGGRGEGVKPPRKSVSLSEKNTKEDKQRSGTDSWRYSSEAGIMSRAVLTSRLPQ